MKLKVTCNWTSSEEVTRRLIEQFKTDDINLDKIQFVHDDTYDAIVFLGYINEEVIGDRPTLLFPQEPTWTGGHQKSFGNIKNLKVFGFDIKNYYQPQFVTETISHMFYGGTGPWQEGWDNWNYHNLKNYSFLKTKNICSFVSNRGVNEEHFPDGCLYPNRINLIKELYKKTPNIDFYGWGEGHDNLKHFALRKFDAIKEYKFCLTVENSNENFYISEKFYDCILTDTIPIYFGCKNIKNYWGEGGYFLINDINNQDEVLNLLKTIENNVDEIYNSMLPELHKMKIRYFDEFNLLKKIIKELNIV